MTKFIDSRDPHFGYLILQDHGYKVKGVPDHARGSLVGVRVIGRQTDATQAGEWTEDEFARGTVGGASFWPRELENAGAWQFGYAAICAEEGVLPDNFSSYDARRSASGGLVPRGRRYPDTSGPPKEEPQPEAPTPEKKAGAEGKANNGKGTGDGLNRELEILKRLTNENRVRMGLPQLIFGLNVNPLQGLVGVNPGLQVNGLFGINVSPDLGVVGVNPSYTINGIFGINVDPYNINTLGASSHRDIIVKRAEDQEEANEAWYWFDDDTVARLPLRIFPSARSWVADGRHTVKQPSVLTGWPDFPYGYAGYVQQSTTEEEQAELWLPADPRLVAVNVGSPFTCGSVVTDITSAGYMDVSRSARLQSMMRVVLAPNKSSGAKVLATDWDGRSDDPPLANRVAGNANPKTNRQNWLAWNIGPAGQWDCYGGLVCDLPDAETLSRGPRIMGMVSVRDGGPFDVGSASDRHRWGKDGDGNPINSLHLSTDSYFRVRGSDTYDGSLFFEYVWPDPPDLTYPVHCHIGYDLAANLWKIWTTSLYTTTPPYTPEPEEPPDHPKTPKDPTPTPDPEPVPTKDGNRDPTKRKTYGITHMEVVQPSLAFAAQDLTDGEIDFAHTQTPDPLALRDYHRTSPVVARLEAYGDQSGSRFNYTYEPGNSTYLPGTAGGGLAFLPPEITLENLNNSLAPAWIDRSTSYLVAGTGTFFAAGLPYLDTGGVKTGWRWGADSSGNMNWSVMSSTGAATEHAVFRADGTVFTKRRVATTGVNYAIPATVDVVLASAAVTVTLPDATESLGRTVVVKNIATAVSVTVDSAAGTIDGDASESLADDEVIAVISDGNNWYII